MPDVRIRNVRVRVRGGSPQTARQSVPQLRDAIARAMSGTGSSEPRSSLASRIASPIADVVRSALKGPR